MTTPKVDHPSEDAQGTPEADLSPEITIGDIVKELTSDIGQAVIWRACEYVVDWIAPGAGRLVRVAHFGVGLASAVSNVLDGENPRFQFPLADIDYFSITCDFTIDRQTLRARTGIGIDYADGVLSGPIPFPDLGSESPPTSIGQAERGMRPPSDLPGSVHFVHDSTRLFNQLTSKVEVELILRAPLMAESPFSQGGAQPTMQPGSFTLDGRSREQVRQICIYYNLPQEVGRIEISDAGTVSKIATFAIRATCNNCGSAVHPGTVKGLLSGCCGDPHGDIIHTPVRPGIEANRGQADKVDNSIADEKEVALPTIRSHPPAVSASNSSFGDHDNDTEEDNSDDCARRLGGLLAAEYPGLWDEPAEQSMNAPTIELLEQLAIHVFVVDGRPRYHLVDCSHLAGRPSESLPVSEALELGFTPCALCRPNTSLV